MGVGGHVVTFVASTVFTTGTTATALQRWDALGTADAAQFILTVTASNTPTTCDVYLQHSPDEGTTWYDFAHFTQVGAVSTSTQSASWSRRNYDGTQGTAVIATGDAALAAAKVIAGPIAGALRAKVVVVGTSYTLAITAITDKDS